MQVREGLVLDQEGIPERAAERVPLDAGTLDALVRAEYGRIRGLAWRFGIPAADLDDAVQEVFLRAVMGWNGFEGRAAVSTWLTRVAVNHFTSRRTALRRRLRMFLHHPVAMETAPAPTGATAEQLEAHDRALALLKRLPPRLRRVVVLRCLEEMSGPEVAEALGIPEATVRTRLHNARKKLKAMMAED